MILIQNLQGISIERIPFASQFENALFILKDKKSAEYLNSILNETQKHSEVILLDFFDSKIYETAFCDASIFIKRARELTKIANLKNKIIITTLESFNYKIPLQSYFTENFEISKNSQISINSLIDKLLDFGYSRVEVINGIGQFAIRGGIVDIFPNISNYPVRIDFFGDIVESIREFDIESQISKNHIEKILITKNSEIILNDKTKHIFRQKFKFDNPRIRESIENGNYFPGIEWYMGCFHEKIENLKKYVDKDTIFVLDSEIEKVNQIFFENCHEKFKSLKNSVPEVSDIFEDAISEIKNPIKAPLFENNSIFKNHGKIYNIRKISELNDLLKNIKDKTKVIFSVSSNGALNIISEILKDQKINRIEKFYDAKKFEINLIVSKLNEGFVSNDLIIYTEKELFGEVLKFAAKRKNSDIFKDYSKLSVGDYVVHERHGIAIFEGLINISISEIPHDFLSLCYKNDDKLYVPVENISLISRYGGDDSNNVQLDLLKSNSWTNRKINVRKKLLIIANNLLQLAAKRHVNKIDPMEIPENYENFCKGFGYLETDNQLSSIQDVIYDLQHTTPMDRLVCGDVGFGKTEVALRAAFIVASNLKQVVLLAPTTILVSQHYKNFVKRFEGFDIKICQLSRFVSPKQMKENLKDISNGDAQIIIATHSILSSKVKFHDLGLVIIDEEQHFGVKQKEFLKSINGNAHFMTLSATPIPRTLQLAVSGVKELSMIVTPPTDRLPVRTIICDFEKDVIKNAIESELKIGGQVFFVTPRVEYLDELYKLVVKILPNIKVQKVHGKTENLEEILKDFCDSKIDVLISTNIIDSGIDIPNANTILVHRFDLFGLSQLYQLRGRVGRSKRQAYAYFLMVNDKILTKDAKKRMDVLNNLNKLGSGFNLASYDMDIRGAGNLLGDEQSGYIKEVGVELYQSMLQEAILMLKAGGNINQDLEKLEPQINLGCPVFIPDFYIEDSNLRLEIYRKIGRLNNQNEIDMMEFELNDRFGRIPYETQNLLTLIKIKINCQKANVEKIDVGPTGLTFSFFENRCKSVDGLMNFLKSDEVKSYDGSAKIRPDHKIVISKKWQSSKERTEDIFRISEKFSNLL